MALFDFIRNRNNNNNIPIEAVVQDNDTQIAQQVGNAIEKTKFQNALNTVKDNLFGKLVNMPTEENSITTDENGNPTLNTAINNPVRQGGFLNDMAAGFRENYNTPFKVNNLLDDNQNKGFANRLGEAIGTAGRILTSPLGRGLLTAGIVKATGGDGLDALSYGLQTAATNQKLKSGDALYRNALDDSGVDTSKANGYIGKDDYNAINNGMYKYNSLNVRQSIANQTDNTKRANMIMQGLNNGMISPAEAKILMQDYGITINDLQDSNNTKLLPAKEFALYTAPQVALGNLGISQGRLALDTQKYFDEIEQRNNPQISTADRKTLTENNQTLANIDEAIKQIEANPSAYGPVKGLLHPAALNIIDKKGIPTRALIDNITAVYRKWLTGAQMSDKERQAYERFLPAPTDTGEAILYKLQAMRNTILRNNNVIMQGYQGMNNNFNPQPKQNKNNDPLGIR